MVKLLSEAAPAKINLFLRVTGRRADGYHELRTIFQTVSLHDMLEFRESRRPGIALQIEGNEALAKEDVERNLVYRAVEAVRRETRLRPGVDILLKKKIPAGRGLGGGSSNAAAAILGYLQFSRQKLGCSQLLDVAAAIGSDVPFFLFGGTALGIGKGEEIYPLPDAPRQTLLVVSPRDIHVPTPDAYRWLHAPELASLTKSAANRKLFQFCAQLYTHRLLGIRVLPVLLLFEQPVGSQVESVDLGRCKIGKRTAGDRTMLADLLQQRMIASV